MLPSCSQCGASNREGAEVCSACGAPLPAHEQTLARVAVLSSEPDWRLEVARRLEVYRARRRSRGLPDTQAALPFANGNGSKGEKPTQRAAFSPGGGLERVRRAQRVGIEIAAAQPELDFSAGEAQRNHPGMCVVRVADLNRRLQAGWIDAVLVLTSYAGFVLLFLLLGGRLSFGKYDAAIFLVTLGLFYAEYFSLFTVFGGTTPGMRLVGLRVVSFDGSEPSSEQLLWRSFGYLVSAGTLFLGFLWSLWDEDQLTWHDRISLTYLTDAPPQA